MAALKSSRITPSPNGLALHWPRLDTNPDVPRLIESAFGSRRWMQRIGKLEGQRCSAVQAKA